MSERMALIARLGAAAEQADGPARELFMEALAALVEDAGVIASAARRRAKDRSRHRPDSTISVDSADSAEMVESVESTEDAEIRVPPSPSSSFPTPHITPSSPPPTNQPTNLVPPNSERTRLRAVFDRFVAGMDRTAMLAWDGRVRGAVDRDGWTWSEVADALEDLMATKARSEWSPVVLRAYLGRARRAIAAEAGRDAAAAETPDAHVPRGTRTQPSADAADALAEVRGLVESVDVPGQGRKRFLRMPALASLGERYVQTVQRIGGIARILSVEEHPEKIDYLLRDWAEQWRVSA